MMIQLSGGLYSPIFVYITSGGFNVCTIVHSIKFIHVFATTHHKDLKIEFLTFSECLSFSTLILYTGHTDTPGSGSEAYFNELIIFPAHCSSTGLLGAGAQLPLLQNKCHISLK